MYVQQARAYISFFVLKVCPTYFYMLTFEEHNQNVFDMCLTYWTQQNIRSILILRLNSYFSLLYIKHHTYYISSHYMG